MRMQLAPMLLLVCIDACAALTRLPLRSASSPSRAPYPQANFFASFLPPPPPNPADAYEPDMACDSPGLPRSYDEIASGAIAGVRAALDSGVTSMEVQYPPVASANARGDGSAKSERLVAEANAKFALKLSSKLGRKAVIVAGSGDAARALGTDAISLRDAAGGFDVAICVAPCTDEQWDAALGLESKAIVVVNGLLQNGRLPHAYYYQPMTAFSQQTGGVVRCYPGPYECFSSDGTRADLEIPLARQGRRACAVLAFEPNRPHHFVLDSHAPSTWRSFATQLAGYQERADVTAEQVWATPLRSRNAPSCVLLLRVVRVLRSG